MARVFSMEKIAKGDINEQARLLYSIAPSKFSSLAKKQGVLIESEDDLDSLLADYQRGEITFNFRTLFNHLPINSKEISRAGKQGIVIV